MLALALSLGLLPTTLLSGCDSEPVDEAELELRERHAHEIQLQLEREQGVQLERTNSANAPLEHEFELDFEFEGFGFTEARDDTTPPAEGACGLGYWDYDSRPVGCDKCDITPDETGKKYDYYKRWCYEGPPSCGGCGGWQYTGWGCLQGCW